MPGLQKGKPHKPGAGRPRQYPPDAVRVTVTLAPDDVAFLRRVFGGRLSEAVRFLVLQARDREA